LAGSFSFFGGLLHLFLGGDFVGFLGGTGVGLAQGKLVLAGLCAAIFDLGLYPTFSASAGLGQFGAGCSSSQIGAVFGKVSGLRFDGLARFCGGGLLGFLCAGQFQHSTGFEAVDIVVNECIGVGAQQGQ